MLDSECGMWTGKDGTATERDTASEFLDGNFDPRILDPETLNSEWPPFARDVLAGLTGSPKTLPCKYLYDSEGSLLFQKIMELPEYYLTRCEMEILSSYRQRLARILGGRECHLVELGAGDGRKTRLLIDCFLERGLDFRYVPIDISRGAMQSLIETIGSCCPSLEIKGLICEYAEGLKWLSRNGRGVKLVLFLGSTIGNLSHLEAKAFFRNLRDSLNPGDYVLTGFDLRKDVERMSLAYNDSLGVTARFNMNLLNRINRELGGDFDLNRFAYYSAYNPHSGSVESFLISRERQQVWIEALGRRISFHAGEALQTEFSHKYLLSDVDSLAMETGFTRVENVLDSKGYFVDSLWQVR